MRSPITALLVAGRGEIAVRIMTTAASLRIRTVAVHPDDDAACAHVTRADAAVPLPGTGAAAYLDVEEIVAAARRTGCDAVHPGYGFLSESAVLARRCTEEGLTFVGPAPEALALFGDKTAARARARMLGVPVPAGTDGPTDLAAAEAFLASLGPDAAVMVKAVAGGGGRGMRPVTHPDELPDALRRCASEARAAFGDGAVYLERLLPRARHVEVQLVGDGTGAVVALGDRDCSVQRRRQKLIEIAPAPRLDAALRARLHEAAVRLVASTGYAGLATVEFLIEEPEIRAPEIAFLEVNPRLQVEHTVTEEVTGLDLVEVALRVAEGASLAELGLTTVPAPRGVALQARINTETLRPDGSLRPAAGTLTRFQPPPGRGVRVDTHGYAGYPVSPRYDSLLAKLIVAEPRGDLAAAAARATRALAEFDIAGVATNRAVLRALLAEPRLVHGGLDTAFVDDHLAELPHAEDDARTSSPPGGPAGRLAAPPGTSAVRAGQQGVVVDVAVAKGETVAPGAELVVLEAMKMEHVVRAGRGGVVDAVAVRAGDTVDAGTALVFLVESGGDVAGGTAAAEVDLDDIRPDLAETLARHRIGLDEGRPGVVQRRHAGGRRTARENIDDLCDPGSFVEYGALAIAAQRRRRALDDLIERTPADGLVAGTATIGGRPAAVMSYDYTVLAGTQGIQNHRKTDRLLTLARRGRLPVVIFAEGGGGRPGDTDTSSVAGLDVPTFRLAAGLAGNVPLVAIVSGYCFAGNAALVGCCDVVIATDGSSLGMGGPAMIEGGGLGVVAPADVGPMPVQVAAGVVDVLVDDEAAAVETARRYLSYFAGPGEPGPVPDQRALRHLVPENRVRSYDVRPVLATLADAGSVLELRAGFGTGIITALARIAGRPVGVIANNPGHLGGAIDAEAADKATRFLELCEAHRLPVVSLCDTPGFMVGPDAERTATVRRFGAMFVAGARLTVPLCMVVLRKAYGLGAMAMAGGDLHAPLLTVSWPTGEFGGMGLEGAVRLGYRAELSAIADPQARRARYDELVASYYERGKALSTAMSFEVDDVADPAETRSLLIRALTAATAGEGG